MIINFFKIMIFLLFIFFYNSLFIFIKKFKKLLNYIEEFSILFKIR